MSYLGKVREKSPLIYNIMNEVASNFSANGLIAIGASPSISNTPREAKEMAKHADAVVLNLGTLSEDRAEAMMIAGQAANEAGVPVLLDPIAVGATDFRTKAIYELLSNVTFTAICANASEIAVLGGELDKTTSPDGALDNNDPAIAKKVANKYRTTVIATGETDIITNGTQTALCNNGHPMLQNITASGCLLTSVIGAFISIAGNNVFEASIEAVTSYGIAAELAMNKAAGPGTFIPEFLDGLYHLTENTMKNHKQITQL